LLIHCVIDFVAVLYRGLLDLASESSIHSYSFSCDLTDRYWFNALSMHSAVDAENLSCNVG